MMIITLLVPAAQPLYGMVMRVNFQYHNLSCRAAPQFYCSDAQSTWKAPAVARAFALRRQVVKTITDVLAYSAQSEVKG